MGLFGHVAIISTSIGSRQVGARGPNDALLATTTGPPRGNDQSRAMPVLLTHDEEFETWLRARPTRRSQDGFPEPAKERGRPICGGPARITTRGNETTGGGLERCDPKVHRAPNFRPVPSVGIPSVGRANL